MALTDVTARLVHFLAGASPTTCKPLTGSMADLPPADGDDHLAAVPVAEVAAWYLRLAQHVRTIRSTSVSAAFLEHYIDGKGKVYTLDPDTVRDEPWMRTYLRDKVRPVVLSETPVPHANAVGGVVPRVRGDAPHGPWNGGPIQLHYEGPSVEIFDMGELALLKAKIWAGQELDLTNPDLDLFMALGTGFGIRNDLTVAVDDLGGGTFRARITSWQCRLFDCYDYNEGKHLTMPNPDFGNPFAVDRPIRPGDQRLRVYHRNAFRLEYAGMASRFDVTSVWKVTQPALLAPHEFTI